MYKKIIKGLIADKQQAEILGEKIAFIFTEPVMLVVSLEITLVWQVNFRNAVLHIVYQKENTKKKGRY